MADAPKLPPGMTLHIEPHSDYAPKMPPGMTLADHSQEQPTQFQQFGDKLATDLGNVIPGLVGLPKAVLTHPVQVLRNIGGAFVDPVYDAAHGDYGKSAAGLLELAGPGLMKGTGALLEGSAPKVAEAAMRVGKADRIAAANPGRALIQETNSVRPTSIARDLSAKSAAMGKTLEANAATAPGPANLQPAIDPIVGRIQRAQGAGATATADNLVPMRDYFAGEAPQGFTGATNPNPNGNPLISPTQSPAQVLQMRREFTPNFRIKYGPMADSTTQKVGRQAYRGLTDEVKRTVPEAAELDPRMHDMMAATDAAESTSRNAGFLQRSAGRLMAHTGALTGAVAGGHYFGPAGAAAGLVVPELLASPTAMMSAARGMSWLGRGMNAAPGVGLLPPVAARPRLFDGKQ